MIVDTATLIRPEQYEVDQSYSMRLESNSWLTGHPALYFKATRNVIGTDGFLYHRNDSVPLTYTAASFLGMDRWTEAISPHSLSSPRMAVSMGDFDCVDSLYAHVFHQEVTERENSIYYPINGNLLGEPTHMAYSSVAAHALLSLGSTLQGRKVVDIGSDKGLLGLLALKKGAETTTAIEIEDIETQFASTFRLNGLGSDRFQFVREDITNPEKVVAKLGDPNQFSIAFANIGPHTIYNGAYLHALKLIEKFPQLEQLVLGGYLRGNLDEKTEEFLKKMGFLNIETFYTKTVDSKISHTAFVASR